MQTKDDLLMCHDNERAYERMINADLSGKTTSNDVFDLTDVNLPSSIFLIEIFLYIVAAIS